MSKRYKITVHMFEGEGDSLRAENLYEQTVNSIDLREVILAINSKPEPNLGVPPVFKRKRAQRSDKGKKRVRREPELFPGE